MLVGIGAGVWGIVAVATDHDGGSTTTTHTVIDVDVSGSTTSTTTCTVLAGHPLTPGEGWLTVTSAARDGVQRTDLAGNPA